MRYKIGVIGSAKCLQPDVLEKARRVGKEIAKQECILLTGGTTGVSYEAVKGAKEKNGFTIGFSPAANLVEHTNIYRLPTECFDVLIYSGFGLKGRNVLLVRSCDAILAISGQIGTLNEFTIAWDEQKIVGFLKGTGGICDDEGIKKFWRTCKNKDQREIILHHHPQKLVNLLIEKVEESENQNRFKG